MALLLRRHGQVFSNISLLIFCFRLHIKSLDWREVTQNLCDDHGCQSDFVLWETVHDTLHCNHVVLFRWWQSETRGCVNDVAQVFVDLEVYTCVETGHIENERSKIFNQILFSFDRFWEACSAEPYKARISNLFHKRLQFGIFRNVIFAQIRQIHHVFNVI